MRRPLPQIHSALFKQRCLCATPLAPQPSLSPSHRSFPRTSLLHLTLRACICKLFVDSYIHTRHGSEHTVARVGKRLDDKLQPDTEAVRRTAKLVVLSVRDFSDTERGLAGTLVSPDGDVEAAKAAMGIAPDAQGAEAGGSAQLGSGARPPPPLPLLMPTARVPYLKLSACIRSSWVPHSSPLFHSSHPRAP